MGYLARSIVIAANCSGIPIGWCQAHDALRFGRQHETKFRNFRFWSPVTENSDCGPQMFHQQFSSALGQLTVDSQACLYAPDPSYASFSFIIACFLAVSFAKAPLKRFTPAAVDASRSNRKILHLDLKSEVFAGYFVNDADRLHA